MLSEEVDQNILHKFNSYLLKECMKLIWAYQRARHLKVDLV